MKILSRNEIRVAFRDAWGASQNFKKLKKIKQTHSVTHLDIEKIKFQTLQRVQSKKSFLRLFFNNLRELYVLK